MSFDQQFQDLECDIHSLEVRKKALLETKVIIEAELLKIEKELAECNEIGLMLSKAEEKASEDCNKIMYGI